MTTADELLDDAAAEPFRGWDFSWIAGRFSAEPPRWDFTSTVRALLRDAASMLDMGTGGGEWLSTLAPLPGRAVATEAWGPNVPVAAERLLELRVPVVRDEGATDNVDQRRQRARGRLPFRDGAFDLVTNRHEAFTAAEVARVLRAGGAFATQQADPASARFHELLGLPAPTGATFDLRLAVEQAVAAGLDVVESAEGVERLRFADVGALAWYLKAVPWAVPGFTVDAYREPLRRVHGTELLVEAPRFWLLART